jgi:hypothetical protein
MCKSMKIYKMLADICPYMPSFALQMTGVIIVAATLVVAFISPVTATAVGEYQAVVKILSGLAAITGSLSLAAAIGRTFLCSGGIAPSRAAYVATMALSGPGLAEALSAFQPVDMGNVLIAYCAVSIVSGALWVRFYGRAD